MPSTSRIARIFWLSLVGAVVVNSAHAGSAVLQPVKDNTLYEATDGSLSNGAGQYLFAGVTVGDQLRRAVLQFDVAGVIPAGATITGARLVMRLSRAFPGGVDAETTVHRVDADWGESSSDAGGEEGTGTQSERDDATWIHTFFDQSFWVTPGGDFTALPSASTVVGSVLGPYSWSGAGLVADVQSWLDTPATNFGWMLIADESALGSAKRFDSRESPFIPNRPRLLVEFTVAGVGSARVPQSTMEGSPLVLTKLVGGNLQLDWDTSCLVTDVDYSVYEGVLGAFTSHLPVTCSTGMSPSLILTPTYSRAYYLVVPVSSGGVEGSYGLSTGSVERPLGIAACLAQVVIPCP